MNKKSKKAKSLNKQSQSFDQHIVIGIVLSFCVFTRVLYHYFIAINYNFNKWLPAQFDKRVLAIIDGEKIHYLTSWASYHLFLVPIYFILDKLTILNERLDYIFYFNVVFQTISAFFVFKIAQKLFKNFWLSVVACFLFGAYYPLIYFAQINVSENLFTLLIIVSLYLLLDLKDANIKVNACFIGLFLGAALVIRPILTTFLPLVIIWVFFIKLKNSKKSFSWFLVLYLFGLSSIVLSANFINSKLDAKGYFAYSSNTGANLAMNWCKARIVKYVGEKGKVRQWFGPPVWRKDYTKNVLYGTKPFANDNYYKNKAIECIKDNPQNIFLNLWNIKNIFDSIMYPNFIFESWHYKLLSIFKVMNIILFISFLSYPFIFRNSEASFDSSFGSSWHNWLIAAFMIASMFASVYIANPGEERYLVPYFFIIIIWGLVPIMKLFMRLFDGVYKLFLKQNSQTKSAICFVALILLFLSQPVYQTVAKSTFNNKLQKSYVDASEWFIHNQRSDGGFVYGVDVNTGETMTVDNEVRQLLGSHSVANLAARLDNEELTKVHNKNLKFIFSHLKKSNELIYFAPKKRKAPVVSQTAFVVITLIDSPHREFYRKQIAKIAEFLLFMQEQDGQFAMLYPKSLSAKLKPKQRYAFTKFASGEAALACVKAYEFLKDERFLECADKSHKYYSKFLKENYDHVFASWHLIAYSQLNAISPKKEYLETIDYLSQKMLPYQNKVADINHYRGGFDLISHHATSSEAVYTEGLVLAAGEMCKNSKRSRKSHKCKRLKHSAKIGIENLMHYQVKDSETFKHGAIRSESSSAIARLDNTAHTVMAFQQYMEQNRIKFR